MTSTGPSTEAQGYLESLMHTGQDAMKQFDHALVSAAGVGTKESLSSSRHFFPFAMIADLQRDLTGVSITVPVSESAEEALARIIQAQG